MTDFGSLIYTDCTPGQGLSGGAGLQFQAVSAEVDGDAMAMVQRHLLYEPPSGWMRERRPLADYPPSLAHIGGAQLATAAGIYLGKEANGTREGNQLTHALVTRDPRAYGLLRPAQLFGAPFWCTAPAPTTRCDPIPAEPPPGVLTADAVHDFVRQHPEGSRLLAALLTVLCLPDDGRSPQVMFIADQAEPVLGWIAAATLLLPHRQALQIGFKVFTTAPDRSVQRVLAVHPGWDTPPASVDRPSGYLVVDLLAGRWSEVEVCPRAAAWADLFCAADPYDVSDAVELAAGSRLDPDAGMSLARVAVLRQAPAPEHAEAVVGWLTEGPAELVSAYGASLAATFTTDVAAQPLGLLRKLDRATRDGGFDQQAVPVRMALLRAELRAAVRHGRALREPVPPVTERQWRAEDGERARDLTLRELRGARQGGFAAALDVAGCYRIPIRYGDIGAAADRFVAHWADHPQVPYRPSYWPCGQEFEDRLRDHLNRELESRARQPGAVGADWHAKLEARDPTAPLDAALIGARMAAADEAERTGFVTEVLSRATRAPDPGGEITALSRCLWRWTTPTFVELRALADAARPGSDIDPAAIDAYLDARIDTGTFDSADLDLIHAMVAGQVLRPTAETAAVLESDRSVRRVCAALPTLRKPDASCAKQLAGAHPAVVRLHRKTLVKALVDTPVPATVAAVLDTRSAAFQLAYARRAAASLRERPVPHAVATAVVVAGRSRDTQVVDELLTAVNKWASWAGAGPITRVNELLDTQGHKAAYAQWLKLLDANRIRRGRSWLRGARGR